MRTFANITSLVALPLGLAVAGLGCAAGSADTLSGEPGTAETAEADTDGPRAGGHLDAPPGAKDGDRGSPLTLPPLGGGAGERGRGPEDPRDPDYGVRRHPYPVGEGHGRYGHGGYPRPYWGGGDDDHGYGRGHGPYDHPPPAYYPPPISRTPVGLPLPGGDHGDGDEHPRRD